MNRRSFLLSTAAAAFATGAQIPQKQRHVVLISIDGFGADRLNDASLPLPTIRKLASEGARAEAMHVVNPSVTWPNHTSMVTGMWPAKHGMIYNGMPVRGGENEPVRIESLVDKDVLVQAPTLYDVAHAAGLTTAEVDWVAIQNARTITWAFPERPRTDGKIEREMMEAGLVDEAGISNFGKMPIVWRDEIWTQAGMHILRQHRPNLLLFHLLTTDSTQHQYGVNSLAGNTALALADTKVARLIEVMREAGILERTTVFVIADHGFRTFKARIHPNALLRKLGLVRDVNGKIECDAWSIPEGGTSMVYVTRQAGKAEVVKKLTTDFSALRGVAQVVLPPEYSKHGYPDPAKNDRMCDLVLAAVDGYAFDGVHTGETVTDVPQASTPGAHGYLASESDMNAAFVAWGAGVKAGTKLGPVRTIDIAPTVAQLLGLQLKNADGRVLQELLG